MLIKYNNISINSLEDWNVEYKPQDSINPLQTVGSLNTDFEDEEENLMVYLNKKDSMRVKSGKLLLQMDRFSHETIPKNTKMDKICIKSSILSHMEKKFLEIMKVDNISPADMKSSLSLATNRKMVFRAGQGTGQSGSFFFFSHDNKFIIKTLRGEERKILLRLLDEYIQHIKLSQNKSLLARVYGVFTIKTDYFTDLDVIVMQNTVRLTNKANQKLVFDLKGSTKGRKTALQQRFWLKELNDKNCLKDLNFLEINRDLNDTLVRFS
jgi:hypothetical protein